MNSSRDTDLIKLLLVISIALTATSLALSFIEQSHSIKRYIIVADHNEYGRGRLLVYPSETTRTITDDYQESNSSVRDLGNQYVSLNIQETKQ